MTAPFQRMLDASGQRSNLVVRLLVGLVFLPEGVKKFLFPEQWGAGRFARIGIPAPEAMAQFVGAVEIIFAGLLLAGLLTRLSAVPLLVDIAVAIATTKSRCSGEQPRCPRRSGSGPCRQSRAPTSRC